jgi:arsenite methyltransferase
MSCCGSKAKCGPSSSNAPVEKPNECVKESALENQESELRKQVRTHYANIVTSKTEGDCGSCFLPNKSAEYAMKLGYNDEDLKEIPAEANIGQGCGNPIVFSQLKPGEVVLDLGSGAGFDAFLAAKAVGRF